jgi:SAM-dependent methyltransferase
MNIMRSLVRRFVPVAVRQWWRRGERVAMGDLRSLEPPGRLLGFERGLPVCRWYIERFLEANAAKIAGTVLEVADAAYTRRYGGSRVTTSDVLHTVPGNASATIVGDLATGEWIPHGRFDAAILTQVLQCVFDVQAAVRTVHGALKPGGTALVTLPAIAPVSRYDAERWGEYWHFTEQSARRLFDPVFGAANVAVQAFGNHAVAHAYIAGMAAEELRPDELAAFDPDYPVVVTVVATRR